MKTSVNQRLGQSGVSLIVSTMLLVGFGLAGLKVVEMSATEITNSTSEMNSETAEAAAQAGLEAALHELYQGHDPTKTFSLGEASIDITTDPNLGLVTVSGIVDNGIAGDAKRTYQIETDFSSNNVILDVSQAFIQGRSLQGMLLQKSGSRTAIVDRVTVSWNQSDCAKNISCVEEMISPDNCKSEPNSYDSYVDPDHSNKVLVCHGGKTLSISASAWQNQGHSCHVNDSLGACSSEQIANADPQACSIDQLSETQQQELLACSIATGDNTLQTMTVEGTKIFEANLQYALSDDAPLSGEVFDVQDFVMQNSGAYTVNAIDLGSDIQNGTWFTVRIDFADKSYIEKSFQVFMKVPTETTDTPVVEQQTTVSTDPQAVVQGIDGDFHEDGGKVIVSDKDNYKLTVEVIAVEITCGTNGPYIPVKVDIAKNNIYSTAFSDEAVSAGQSTIIENLQTENAYKIRAKASLKSCSNFSTTVESTHKMVYSLVNGDFVPNSWAGFGGQKPVQEILSDYVSDNGKMKLAENQVILLFELGTKNNNDSADYQDLVVLITVDRMP